MNQLSIMNNFKLFGQKTALIIEGKELSYELLDKKIHFFKEKLSKDCLPGGVVAIVGDYSFNAISIFLALAELKCIVVPIATKIEQEINDRIEISGANVLIRTAEEDIEVTCINTTRNDYASYAELRVIQKSGLVLFSSGSTGKPKAMVQNLHDLMASYEGRRAKSLCFMIFLMFDHIGGINSLLNGLATGTTLVLVTDRDPVKVAELVELHKVNVLPASPTFLNLLVVSGVVAKYDFSSVRMITYGTEAMPDALLVRLRKFFPRAKLLQTFGTSETGIATTSSKSSNSTFIKFNDPNLEYRIENGELWLRSKTQIMSYLNASMEGFTDDGWFCTGDLVQEEDGYIRIIGRKKEIINVGGEKVLPSEVESCLLEIPEVADCMVYAEKHALTGECVVAQVVPSSQSIKDKDLVMMIQKFCYSNLSRYKVPSRIDIVLSTNIGSRFKKMRISDK